MKLHTTKRNPILRFTQNGVAYVNADELFQVEKVKRDLQTMRELFRRYIAKPAPEPTDAEG